MVNYIVSIVTKHQNWDFRGKSSRSACSCRPLQIYCWWKSQTFLLYVHTHRWRKIEENKLVTLHSNSGGQKAARRFQRLQPWLKYVEIWYAGLNLVASQWLAAAVLMMVLDGDLLMVHIRCTWPTSWTLPIFGHFQPILGLKKVPCHLLAWDPSSLWSQPIPQVSYASRPATRCLGATWLVKVSSRPVTSLVDQRIAFSQPVNC